MLSGFNSYGSDLFIRIDVFILQKFDDESGVVDIVEGMMSL